MEVNKTVIEEFVINKTDVENILLQGTKVLHRWSGF